MSDPYVAMLEQYFDLMSTNGATQVFHAATDCGLFDALRDGPRDLSTILEACQTKSHPTKLLLDALIALDVVRSGDDGYTLAPVMHFLTGDYRELGNRYWKHLPKLLENGEPLIEMDSLDESESHYQTQAIALRWMMGPAAEAAAIAMQIEQHAGLQIIDVGCGSAIWSLTCAKRDEAAHITAVDWPAVLQVAAGIAEDFGLTERLTLLPGNYHEVPLSDSAYDLAIVANVTHLESVDGSESLFRKLHRALKPGGRIAIADVMPGQPQGDLHRTLYELGLALRTKAAEVHSPQALEQMLLNSGFVQATIVPLPAPPYIMGLVLAARP